MNQLDLESWPPPYTIRRSKRIKRIALRVSKPQGLEIVIPYRTKIETAIAFLHHHYDWVQKHRHLLIASQLPFEIPTAIYLTSINEIWRVDYPAIIKRPLLANKKTRSIQLKDMPIDHVQRAMKRWLLKKANEHLPVILEKISKQCQLPFQHVTIRYQKSRWGSCSREKRINLNCKLLLLPYELSHYIIVHELVHTIHFDHSPAFWHTVSQYIPEYKQLRAQLKTVEQQMPNWLY